MDNSETGKPPIWEGRIFICGDSIITFSPPCSRQGILLWGVLIYEYLSWPIMTSVYLYLPELTNFTSAYLCLPLFNLAYLYYFRPDIDDQPANVNANANEANGQRNGNHGSCRGPSRWCNTTNWLCYVSRFQCFHGWLAEIFPVKENDLLTV